MRSKQLRPRYVCLFAAALGFFLYLVAKSFFSVAIETVPRRGFWFYWFAPRIEASGLTIIGKHLRHSSQRAGIVSFAAVHVGAPALGISSDIGAPHLCWLVVLLRVS